MVELCGVPSTTVARSIRVYFAASEAARKTRKNRNSSGRFPARITKDKNVAKTSSKQVNWQKSGRTGRRLRNVYELSSLERKLGFSSEYISGIYSPNNNYNALATQISKEIYLMNRSEKSHVWSLYGNQTNVIALKQVRRNTEGR